MELLIVIARNEATKQSPVLTLRLKSLLLFFSRYPPHFRHTSATFLGGWQMAGYSLLATKENRVVRKGISWVLTKKNMIIIRYN